MTRLEHQIAAIMDAMYDSINNDNFDSISDYANSILDVVDNDYDRDDKDNDDMLYDKDNDDMLHDKDNDDMPYDKDNDDMPYNKDNDDMPYDKDNDDMPYDKNNDNMPYDRDNDEQMPKEYANDNETAITEVKYDRNVTKDALKNVCTKDGVVYKRDDKIMTKVKRPIQMRDIDAEFMRKYDDMCKSMEDRQINDFYEAQRQIQSVMEGDIHIKTGQNRQCIDYDREHDRIFQSVCHRLDLGPNLLPGAQQHTTVESGAALKIQEKIESKHDENRQNINDQYRNEMYKMAENIVPQLDGILSQTIATQICTVT